MHTQNKNKAQFDDGHEPHSSRNQLSLQMVGKTKLKVRRNSAVGRRSKQELLDGSPVVDGGVETQIGNNNTTQEGHTLQVHGSKRRRRGSRRLTVASPARPQFAEEEVGNVDNSILQQQSGQYTSRSIHSSHRSVNQNQPSCQESNMSPSSRHSSRHSHRHHSRR